MASATSSTQNAVPSSQIPPEIMIFNIDLSQMREVQVSLQPDADEKWSAISGPDEFVPFSRLIAHINACTDPKYLVDAFDDNLPQLDVVTTELNRHLNYMHKILTAAQFMQFTSQMRLDSQSFYSLLQPNQVPLFNNALLILSSVMNVVKDQSLRHNCVMHFCEFLVPDELKLARKKRPYIRTILYLPAHSLDDDTNVWITLNIDFNTVQIYQFDLPDAPMKTFTLEQFVPDIYAEQLSFSSVLQPGVAIMTFTFITNNAGRTWIDTFQNKEEDPLLIFMSTIPHAMEHYQYIPDDFRKQLTDIVVAPDLDLARAICWVAANEFRDGEHTKLACGQVLALLSSTGNLTQFVRCAFARAIEETTDTTNILRMSSIASMSSGLILTYSDCGFAAACAAAMKNDNGNLPSAINHFMQLEKSFTAPMRFILSTAFRATRRKFPDYLVPLNAISSIFVLRYLATELTNISMDMAKLCQTLTLTLMFSTKVEQLPEDLYPQLALFLTNLTYLKNNAFTFPPINDNDIINFIKYQKDENRYLQQIVLMLSSTLKNDQHPMVWSMVELIENIFTGTDEDFQNEMASKTFLPQRYVRKVDNTEQA